MATRMLSKSARAGRELALGLMRQHGLGSWEFAFDARKRRCGACYHAILCPVSKRITRKGRITLSLYFVELNPLDVVRKTLLHEIAHALVGPGRGHGATWRAKCVEIGGAPDRCADVNMPAGPWRASCPSCKKEFNRHRG